ncbi:MAG: VWA domain-containing protein, partial [Hylemonella sp.]|nr:VWA domain-containing protein [Hylemonella sp.]
VSLSMGAADVAPDRLSRARLELSDLLRRLHGERLGLLLYGAQAGLLLPPTADAALFERALGQAGADLLDARGTDIARALQLARQTLGGEAASPSGRGRAVLLLTDAEAASLDGPAAEAATQAVQALRQDGIVLFVLVLASAEGAPVPGRNAVRSEPALAAYAQLARSGGGRLVRVADGDADWQALYDDGLARLPGEHVAPDAARAWRELFALPLGLALALLLWTRLPPAARRALPAVGGLLVLGLLGQAPPALAGLPFEPAPAQTLPQAAAQAYRAGHWAQALPLFERQGGYAGHMGAGACAWKLRDHAAAAHHFSRALLLAHNEAERDDALYNLGNAEFGLGRWLSAAQAWQAVLRSRPQDGAAAANLAQARAQLARRGGGAPMKSDLRGRSGFIAEGLVGVDGATPGDPREWPDGSASQDRAGGDGSQAAGARLQDAAAADPAQAALQPQRLQSGLVKLERLQERQRALLQGLLKQDRSTAPAPEGRAPW